MGNDGNAYELFVQKVQQALFDAQQIGGYRTVNVQHNIKLVGKDGMARQFDLYWEFELGGHVYRTIIECKDYANDVPVDKVDALVGKLKEFPELKGIIATRNGFQSGAIKKALANGIDVIVVRDEDPKKDWISQDGTPLIRTIVVNLNCIVPAAVLSVDFEFDKTWAKEHGVTEVSYGAIATDILVDNRQTEEQRSVQAIVEDDSSTHGYQDKDIHVVGVTNLDDAYLVLPTGLRVKLLGYKFTYRPGCIIKDEIRVEPVVLGVVEFISDKKKKLALKQDGKTVVKTCGCISTNAEVEMNIDALKKYLRSADSAESSPIKVVTVPYGGLFVHNVLGTSAEPIPKGYESFLDYWEQRSGSKKVQECASVGRHVNKNGAKSEVDEVVGAHVRIDTLTCPNNWAWIVPLCKHCNNDDQTGPIPLPCGTMLIPIRMSCAHATARSSQDASIKLCYRLYVK